MKPLFNKAIAVWDHFWFSPRNLLGLAITRIMVCGTLFGMYAWRQPYVNWFFGDEGIVPRKSMILLTAPFYRPPFTWFQWSDAMMPVVHLLLVILLLTLTLGIGGRKIMWLAWIIHASFIQRNYGAIYGADLIGGLMLLYLSMTKSNARLNLLHLWKKTTIEIDVKAAENDLLTQVGVRMMQIQLCVIYAFTGLEKLRGFSWWDGTALWTVLSNPQMTAFNLSFVRDVPLLIAFFTFATVLFEIYFPVLIWTKKLRPWLVLIGISFHAGIGITMGLYAFATVMTSAYCLFFTETELRDYWRTVQQFFQQRVFHRKPLT